MAYDDPNDLLFASGAKSAKFEEVGDEIEGVIVEMSVKQQTEPGGTLKTWPDGNPMMQTVIDLQTDLREDDGDDGVRKLYVKGGKYEAKTGSGTSMQAAIQAAAAEIGAKRLNVGDTLKVKHTGLGKKTNAAFSAPKLFKAKLTPGKPSISTDEI
jgi:hypothetical protein